MLSVLFLVAFPAIGWFVTNSAVFTMDVLLAGFWIIRTIDKAHKKDNTDVLTSIIFITTTFFAGIALVVFSARADVILPQLMHVYWGLFFVTFVFYFALGPNRATVPILAIVCVMALIAATQINNVSEVSQTSPLFELIADAIEDALFAVSVCVGALPEDKLPPKKKAPKTKHDKRWSWVPLPSPSA